MAENLLNEFKDLEKQVEKNKTEKVRLEERLKGLNEDRDNLLKELAAVGVKEEELEAEILKLETTIKEELAKCKEILDA